MQTHQTISVPETLVGLVDPTRTAVLVYDMQVGIVPHVQEPKRVTSAVSALVDAAHKRDIPVFFSRHYAVPLRIAGVSQLRTAMRFQRAKRAEDLKPHFLQGSHEYQIVEEITPGPDDVVFDKLGMSFFAGTPLEFCLRDLGIITVVVCGCVAEIGLVPTLSHAIDLGFLTITAADACGSLSAASHSRVMENLSNTGVVAQTQEILKVWNS